MLIWWDGRRTPRPEATYEPVSNLKDAVSYLAAVAAVIYASGWMAERSAAATFGSMYVPSRESTVAAGLCFLVLNAPAFFVWIWKFALHGKDLPRFEMALTFCIITGIAISFVGVSTMHVNYSLVDSSPEFVRVLKFAALLFVPILTVQAFGAVLRVGGRIVVNLYAALSLIVIFFFGPLAFWRIVALLDERKLWRTLAAARKPSSEERAGD